MRARMDVTTSSKICTRAEASDSPEVWRILTACPGNLPVKGFDEQIPDSPLLARERGGAHRFDRVSRRLRTVDNS